MLQTISLGISVYGVVSMFLGKVYIRRGMSMEWIEREEQPVDFWISCGIYLGLGLFLAYAIHVHENG